MSSAEKLSWSMLVIGVVGFVVSFPLWLMNRISDHQMLGLTLILSWAALWYAAALFIYSARNNGT